jgi:hypothetical protein
MMMTKPTFDIVDRETEVSEGAIAVLEEALEMVRSGELSEVLLVGLKDDGSSWVAMSGTQSVKNQIAYLEMLKFDLLFAVRDEV